VAVVGVGSDLRGDDVAGVLVARRLAAWAARTRSERVLALEGGAAPENFTGEIVRFEPDLVVLVDAAHLGREPGAVEVIAPERVGGLSFSTHMLPVPIFLDYLLRTIGCRTLVIGIDIVQKEVLAPVSPPVTRAVRRLVAAFQRVLAEV
jgi:hydrogenase 3 maturation protease